MSVMFVDGLYVVTGRLGDQLITRSHADRKTAWANCIAAMEAAYQDLMEEAGL